MPRAHGVYLRESAYGRSYFAGPYNAAISSSYLVELSAGLGAQLPPPLPLLYEHVNTKCELIPPPNKIDATIVCMHHLTTYLWLMGQLAERVRTA